MPWYHPLITSMIETFPGDTMRARLIQFLQQSSIGIDAPSDGALSFYAGAFTHPSYTKERIDREEPLPYPDTFERLEFLGDRVLNLVVAEYLFKDSQQSEGAMTSRMEVVKNQNLGAIVPSLDIGFTDMIVVGQNQKKTTRIIASSFEAFIGAFFLDRGLDDTTQMLMRLIGDEIATFSPDDNYKKQLQEKVQRSMGILPEYILSEKTGPDHCPLFTYHVMLDKRISGTGTGPTKAVATQNAARDALRALDRNP